MDPMLPPGAVVNRQLRRKPAGDGMDKEERDVVEQLALAQQSLSESVYTLRDSVDDLRAALRELEARYSSLIGPAKRVRP